MAVTVTVPPVDSTVAAIRTFGALCRAGYRRHATYRQATVAGLVTNTVFGFLKCYVLLAVAESAAGLAAGYDARQLVTYVWVGQGMFALLGLWGWTELADRIRSGDVVSDLLRPVPPVVSYLATDLGRAGYALLTRFLPPLLAAPLFFDVYLPHRWWTGPLFAVSALVAIVIGFSCRYLVNAAAYWLYDVRGPMILWLVVSSALAGLAFPLRFLPEPLMLAVWVATPLAGLFQTPLDVVVERDPPAVQFGLVAGQLAWAVVMLLVCAVVQRRAERRLVVQGG
ncbi:ABC transporter permease [Plantactinospora sp. GCM10030261]|uniref:ABC transporter permease n=1 Tax=Plantactinospora sp. GCM10030261 TaxID=3273420 RepID=UPI0036208152